MDDATLTQVTTLEEGLWRAETRFDDAFLAGILAEDFVEFGWSGRTYQRSDLIGNRDPNTSIRATLPLRDFWARYLADDLVLVTYVSEEHHNRQRRHGNRSSIWTRSAEGWQLRFHQATPTTVDMI